MVKGGVAPRKGKGGEDGDFVFGYCEFRFLGCNDVEFAMRAFVVFHVEAYHPNMGLGYALQTLLSDLGSCARPVEVTRFRQCEPLHFCR